jgi:hypothetical protein
LICRAFEANAETECAAREQAATVGKALGVDESGLPPLIAAKLRASNVTVPLGGAVPAAELEKSGMSAGDRLVVKHALLALCRLSA